MSLVEEPGKRNDGESKLRCQEVVSLSACVDISGHDIFIDAQPSVTSISLSMPILSRTLTPAVKFICIDGLSPSLLYIYALFTRPRWNRSALAVAGWRCPGRIKHLHIEMSCSPKRNKAYRNAQSAHTGRAGMSSSFSLSIESKSFRRLKLWSRHQRVAELPPARHFDAPSSFRQAYRAFLGIIVYNRARKWNWLYCWEEILSLRWAPAINIIQRISCLRASSCI